MATHRLTRRTFLTNLGSGTFAIAILGPILAACSSGEEGVASTATPQTTGDTSGDPTTAVPEPSTTAGPTTGPPTTAPTTTSDPPPTTSGGPRAATLQRVSLGFVSAYVLARGSEAAIVDTGVRGSEGEIERGLAEIGLGWANVGSVILTHLHPDHIGSLGAVMGSATQADGYAGAADIPSIPSPRPLNAVGDGDSIFGLDIIDTPGHTAGHIAVLDPAGGVLVAGDALNGDGGGVVGPNPQFSPDMAEANASVKKLAALTYSTVVFGHGEPVTADASRLVAELAATL